eukprot:CAMPEP_0173277950 /NCGR_PEP_ID=MMETSP1143-20121109/4357_1 /TAXON_ID=483371 /ORGANISM="non described non described, Strain CCMP2298" /LENGTH=45 /DNA_ID= /DNA_START= /DNA_END= /DNA_ORIENTATION=
MSVVQLVLQQTHLDHRVLVESACVVARGQEVPEGRGRVVLEETAS